MAGRALSLALVAAIAQADTRTNLFDLCDTIPPGTSITIGHHRVTRADGGGCTIENTSAKRPAPTPQTGEGKR